MEEPHARRFPPRNRKTLLNRFLALSLKNSSAMKYKLLHHNKYCFDNKTVLFSNTQMGDHMQNKLQGIFLLAIC